MSKDLLLWKQKGKHIYRKYAFKKKIRIKFIFDDENPFEDLGEIRPLRVH